MPDLVVRSRRVVLPSGVQPAALHVRKGRISAIREFSDPLPRSTRVLDEGERVVSPGLVDTHVHVNQPGRTHWEGFRSATRAAAAGGVTTLVDMPLNSIPPTTSMGALRRKLEAASGRVRVDVGFYGGVVPDNQQRLQILHAAGVLGFKCFLIDSGVEEFPAVTPRHLKDVLPQVKRLPSRLLVHAELALPLPQGRSELRSLPAAERRRYSRYLDSRPESWEEEAVQQVIRLAGETGCPLHVVHLASSRALRALAAARRQGLPITVETCPHYLTSSAEEIPDGATLWKCAPPIREASHREALWEGLREGQIDSIASDHSPSSPDLKSLNEGDFAAAWGGISSLQLTLSLVWTEARPRGFALVDLARWLSDGPARLVALGHRKGRIALGMDADLVVWEPEKQWEVRPEALFHRHPISPYLGRALYGRVERTLLRGETIYHQGKWPGHPRGGLLLRPAGAAIDFS